MRCAGATDWPSKTSREKRKEVDVLACFLTAKSARAVRKAGPSGADEAGHGFSGASSSGMNHFLLTADVVCPVMEAWGSKRLAEADDSVEPAKVTVTEPGGLAVGARMDAE